MNFTYDKQETGQVLDATTIKKPDKGLAIALAKKDRTSYVHNTAALEGNPMTYIEVQTLLEGITIGGHKVSDEQQVLNQNESWSKLLELVENNGFKLNKETFCLLQGIVARNEAIEWGKFRTSMVNIGGTGFRPPEPEDLDDIFSSGIMEITKIENPVLKAFVAFLFAAINQFFFDGNKRTGRLVMNGILLGNGYQIMNIKAVDRLEFNKKMIEFYDSQDATGILCYLLNYYSNSQI